MTGSAYLRLLRARFESNRGHIPGDPVPWELDDKVTALRWAQSAGVATPEYVTSPNRRELTESTLERWGRVVLKQPNSHSSHGVYLLEKLNSGKVFDHFRLKLVDLNSWPVVGHEPSYWLAEKWVDSGIPGALVPPDYKLFCFNGQISHIWQIDRQVKPARIAVFDGAFLPLEHGRHFKLHSTRLQAGSHRLPLHARSMLNMGRRLSEMLGTSFVRIDCFDGPQGPVLGELTFASGPDDAGAILYGPDVEQAIDRGLRNEPLTAASGFEVDVHRFSATDVHNADFDGDRAALALIQSGALQGDQRYPEAARRRLTKRPGSEVLELSLRNISVINGDNRVAYSLQDSLRARTAYVTGERRRIEFQRIAHRYHEARASNPWHAERAAAMAVAANVGG